MRVSLDQNSVDDYRLFLKIKALPQYSFTGRLAEFPDEYASRIGIAVPSQKKRDYTAPSWMFDYQKAITKLAIQKQKFAVFADCGLGKTAIILEYARHAARTLPKDKRVLIVSPLMVINQTLNECQNFFGRSLQLHQVKAADLGSWLRGEKEWDWRIGITNYEALDSSLPQGRLGCLILDESSMLKSHYGKWGRECIRLGKGLEWKLCSTGTPAPNDRIEYANHAVFLDHFPTVNAFLARFFVNRGQTNERWELKHHALHPFYRALSHWCIFLSRPAVYGWKDNAEPLPPINVHVHDVAMTDNQRAAVSGVNGDLFGHPGGITSRSTLGQIAKGFHNGEKYDTLKPAFIRSLVDSWPEESTLIWCIYNHEQELMEQTFPEAASISGDTPHETRMRLIDEFKSGARRMLISKGKILGFGLNLQIATRQVFSGLQDSYETYYQCVKRSNRFGASRPLNVHIPITDVERPMVETVLRKASMIQRDTEEQERIFKEVGYDFGR